jgi:hypothetical protein
MSYPFSKTIIIEDEKYEAKAPSKIENKKYDIFKDDKKILSFGDRRYNHYKDRIGYYKHLDTLNKERRRLYRIRHKLDKGVVNNSPLYPGYFSWHFLW